MKNLIKWLAAAGFAAALVAVVLFYTAQETSSIAEIEHYAGEAALSLRASEGCVVIDTGAAVPDGVTVRYTLDGSNPTADSPIYTDPIPIADDIDHVTVVRAAMFYRGECSQIRTETFLPEGMTIPEDLLLVSLTTDPDNLYLFETGILVDGKTKEDFIANGGDYDALEVWRRPANYANRGDAWVRDAHAEFFNADGNLLGAQDVGMSVSGNLSAYYDVKSFKLTSDWVDSKAGEFPEEWVSLSPTGTTEGTQFSSYKKLSLKNGGQDRSRSFLIAPAIYPLIKETGMSATPETGYAAVYLNGEFYSYMYVQQHIDRDYLSDVYQVKKEDLQWYEYDEPAFLRQTDFRALLEQDVNDPAVMEQIEQYVDIDSLLLYYAVEMAVDNRDSILNNFGAWRYDGDPVEENPYTDGRFRFVVFDIDTALHDHTDMYIMVFDEGGNLHSFILDTLLQNPVYRDKFLNITMALLGGPLSADRMVERLEAEKAKQQRWLADPVLGATLAQTLGDLPEDEFETIKAAAHLRKQKAIAAMQQYFNAGETYDLRITVDQPGSYAKLESLRIRPDAPFSGLFFRSSGLELTAVPGPGRRFSHWEVNGQRFADEILHLESDFLADLSAVEIRMVTEAESEGCVVISELSARGKFDWIELYNAGGAPVDLGHLFITNKPKKPFQCKLPAVTLEPGETLILNCKNALTLSEYLVNFNLSAGEILRLTDEEGNVISSTLVPKLDEGKSYGLDPATGMYVYFSTPTKGSI